MSTDIDTDALQDIKGMTPKMLKILNEEGFTSPHQVAIASPDDLTRVQGILDNKLELSVKRAPGRR
nr:helix-hairpin-helix domain-containing protein [Candidatus Sigynarchaeum springense]